MKEDVKRFYKTLCLKAFMMLFNIGFWISGMLLIWCGVWMQMDMETYLKLSTSYSKEIPILFVVLGILIVVAAILGCSSTIKSQYCSLYMYGVFLVGAVLVELTLSAILYKYMEKVAGGFDNGLQKIIQNYNVSSHYNGSSHDLPIDVIQKKLKCCGVNDYKDWLDLNRAKEVPESCCINPAKCEKQEATDIFPTGCRKQLICILDSDISYIGLILSICAFTPLLGAILSCYLAWHTKKFKYQQVN